MNRITRGYLECALWLATDGENGDIQLDEYFNVEDFTPESVALAESRCGDFARDNENDLQRSGLSDDLIGHSLYLTAAGHGTGFWDRGLGAIGDRLTQASRAYGEGYVYVGDDGRLYLS